MLVTFLNLRRQFDQLRDRVMTALEDVCCRSEFVLGDEVRQFEEEFAAYCEADTAAAVNSGTSALHLALLAADVGPGHEVITTPLTSVATCEAITYTGAAPVFADVDPETGTLDPGQLDTVLTERTKAVVPVHLHGSPAGLGPIYEFAVAHDLMVIEDAAEAHGASYKGRRVGSIGTLSVFSFGPEQNLGAYGTGGIVVANDDELVENVRMLRDHGKSDTHHHERIGYNYGMGELEAAVLRIKLRHLDRWTERRRAIAERYYEGLEASPVRMLVPLPQCESSWHWLTVMTPERDGLRDHLTEREIGTDLYCPVPVHLQEAYAHLGYQNGDLPVAERMARESLSLPLYPELRDEEVAHVITCVQRYFGGGAEVGVPEDMPSRVVANVRFCHVGDVMRAYWMPRPRSVSRRFEVR